MPHEILTENNIRTTKNLKKCAKWIFWSIGMLIGLLLLAILVAFIFSLISILLKKLNANIMTDYNTDTAMVK
ncbi:unnamed protein product [Rotaria sordida]|uniref:Uncharacterized protein n=2 Tax=Rotaria sordida TaxID=392033 RepID=A0A815P1H9_9BILA|nr:unnamed protein product [Rotaria sordida]